MRKYYKEIDIARGIGILSVVFFHSVWEGSFIIDYLKELCDSFQMPLFFFLSGFVATSILQIHNIKDYIKLIVRKIRRLLIPYISLSLIVFIPKILLNQFALTKLIPNEFLTNLILKGIHPIIFLWFVYVLFFIFVLYSPILRIQPKIAAVINLVVYAFIILMEYKISIFHLKAVIYYANYFIGGFLVRKYYFKLVEKVTKKHLIAINCASMLLSIVFLNMHLDKYNLNIINGIIGVNTAMLFATLIKDSYIGDKLSALGKYSYDIYLLSWFGQVIVRIVLNQILGLRGAIIFLSMLIAGLATGVISKYFLRNIPIVNRLILGNFTATNS